MMSTRTIKCSETKFQTREQENELIIEGYFAVYNSEYRMWDKAVEVVDPGAFDGELGGDIRALADHDTTMVLGRTRAGTLELRSDEIGLYGIIRINQNDQDAVNLYERVKRGDVDQCSFGFDIIDQESETRSDGVTVWTLRKVKLFEVSVVTFPAYEETSVVARKKDYEEMQKRRFEQWRISMRKRLKGVKENGT